MALGIVDQSGDPIAHQADADAKVNTCVGLAGSISGNRLEFEFLRTLPKQRQSQGQKSPKY